MDQKHKHQAEKAIVLTSLLNHDMNKILDQYPILNFLEKSYLTKNHYFCQTKLYSLKILPFTY